MGGAVSSAGSGFNRQFYVRTKVIRFGAGASALPLESLQDYLQRLDHDTSLRPISSASELQLDDHCKTKVGGFRLTLPAYRQAAQILAPGLSKFLPDIAGMTRSDDNRDQLIDGIMAIQLWNRLMDLRFGLFERYRVIRNENERTIEGFVSYKHQYMENIWLYNESVESLRQGNRQINMHAASLAGRRLALWFKDTTPAFSITSDNRTWPFYCGCYFTNGEATGMSVRGTSAILTPWGVCLAPYKRFGRRVTHIGRDFVERVGEMFASVVYAEIPVDKLRSGAAELLTKSLGFQIDWTAEQRKERAKKITHSLGLLGIQKNLAVEVTDLALATGRYQGVNTTEWSQSHQLYAGRTVLDLFVPLLWTARRLDQIRREKMEQAAFEVLMGRLLL